MILLYLLLLLFNDLLKPCCDIDDGYKKDTKQRLLIRWNIDGKFIDVKNRL